MQRAITAFILPALVACSADPAPDQNAGAARTPSAEEQFYAKYPLHRVRGLTARIGPAPFGDALSVASKAITIAEHPCPKVTKVVRNESDGSITAKCSNGERFNVITVEGIADAMVMRCSAAEELIGGRMETCHSL
ncbi:MAG: hypothetical protein IAG10_31190 [Planctomycetaceae bacterium]|nr:hypothetical protein [Planctomycetaceae bacterium]